MKKLVGSVILAAALLGSAAPVGAVTLADLKKDCRKGNRDACEEYAFRVCVARLEKKGFSTSAAEDRCEV